MQTLAHEQKPLSSPVEVIGIHALNERVTEDNNILKPLAPEDGPPVDHIVTEDDTPVDNFPSAKQQRLLIDPLYHSWQATQPFLADANIGIFYAAKSPPIVPDVFLSLDVQVANDWWTKRHRSYFIWEFGKAPDVVIEIVSNTVGHEASTKLYRYLQMHVPYYVIFDPLDQLGGGVLRLYELQGLAYIDRSDRWLPNVGIGLTLWEGRYEKKRDTWLRWCDREGNLNLTGGERADKEYQRAETEHQRAETEQQRAETEQQRAETEHQEKKQALAKLEQALTKLRTFGVKPEELQ